MKVFYGVGCCRTLASSCGDLELYSAGSNRIKYASSAASSRFPFLLTVGLWPYL